MARARQLLFRIFYSTSYTFVFFVLLAFICASPADILYQSFRRRRVIDIGFISGAYIVTGLFAALIYASRIYTNRSIINAIPKTYMPIDEDELPNKRTWRFVSNLVVRSAVIALQTKPRSRRIELQSDETKERVIAALKPENSKGPGTTDFKARWGDIEHRGWSSPAKDTLPNLEYAVVVAELLDLIEAKAVSLASVAPDGTGGPDDRTLDLLSRPNNAGMRQYLTMLMDLDIIPSTPLAVTFLSHYERARFAPQPLSEDEFQTLMRIFAEVLRSMKPVNLTAANTDTGYPPFDQKPANISGHPAPTTSAFLSRSLSERSASLSDAGSIILRQCQAPSHVSEDSVPSQTTDESYVPSHLSPALNPSSVARRSRADTIQRASISATTSNIISARAETTRLPSAQRRTLHQAPSQTSILSDRSSRSTKSSRSGRSGRSVVSTSGSVIVRLANHDTGLDSSDPTSLPYSIEMPSPTNQ